MPIELSYDEEIDALVMVAKGSIQFDEVITLSKNLIVHPKFRKNISQLFDNTLAEFDLSPDELKKISLAFMALNNTIGLERRLAIAVSRDLDFGLMRMYEVYFQPDPNVEIRVFRSLTEARKWLKETSD